MIRRVFIILILLIVILSGSLIFHNILANKYYLIAKFYESGPLPNYMDVYYKGCKIGYTKGIKLDDNYKYTEVKLIFYKMPKLPENITARVTRMHLNRLCLDLASDSSAPLIKNGSEITGEKEFDPRSFLADIADADIIIPLLQTANESVESFKNTSDEFGKLATNINETLNDNKKELKKTSTNLSNASKTLQNFTKELDLRRNNISNTINNADKSSSNILKATENAKIISDNINQATQNLNQTMETIDSTVSKVNETASNARFITSKIKAVMCKRFAGMRLFFGKP